MSQPESPLGPLKRRDGEPLFDEAWQAQALGMADILVAEGVISAQAWADTLGSELRRSADAGAKDDAATYYTAVLNALYLLLRQSDAVSREEVDAHEDAWRRLPEHAAWYAGGVGGRKSRQDINVVPI